VLLRRLPNDSSMKHLWVGTKLVGLMALTLATALNTSWAQVIAVAVVASAAVIAGRVPWRASPRIPRWFWLSLAVGFVFALIGGGADAYVRFLCFTVLFVALSLVIAWTTELAELAPALSTLGAPLRRLRVPVDEWAVTAALSVRCLPLMLEECRIVLAARRQRPVDRHPAAMVRAVIDVVTACMVAAVRRGSDLGEVIALRGGPGPPDRSAQRFSYRDVVALALVAGASVVPALAA